MGDGFSDGSNDPAHAEAWRGDDGTDHVSAHNDVIVSEFRGGSHGGVVDVNHDGRADVFAVDGAVDRAVDGDGDGYPDEVWLDRDRDGRLDTLLVDADHDHHPDHLLAIADRDHDGTADTVVHIEYRAG